HKAQALVRQLDEAPQGGLEAALKFIGQLLDQAQAWRRGSCPVPPELLGHEQLGREGIRLFFPAAVAADGDRRIVPYLRTISIRVQLQMTELVRNHEPPLPDVADVSGYGDEGVAARPDFEAALRALDAAQQHDRAPFHGDVLDRDLGRVPEIEVFA